MVCGFRVEGVLVAQLCHSSGTGTEFIQGFGRSAHQLSEQAHAPSPYLSTNQKPLETNRNVVVEPCKRLQHSQVGL
jgi:hypothetical protein